MGCPSSQELRLSFNQWIRQIHRWLSLAFTLAVVINIAALVIGSQQTWIGLMALVPLIPLLITGAYLFALPYLAKKPG